MRDETRDDAEQEYDAERGGGRPPGASAPDQTTAALAADVVAAGGSLPYPGTVAEASASPDPTPGSVSDPDPEPALRCVAWCPDDCDEGGAREYVGCDTPREVAEQHAEYLYYERGTRRDCYDVRVRATRGDRAREWDVTVEVEVEVSFCAAIAFPRSPSKASPNEASPSGESHDVARPPEAAS
jgi:hypothetical protein